VSRTFQFFPDSHKAPQNSHCLVQPRAVSQKANRGNPCTPSHRTQALPTPAMLSFLVRTCSILEVIFDFRRSARREVWPAGRTLLRGLFQFGAWPPARLQLTDHELELHLLQQKNRKELLVLCQRVSLPLQSRLIEFRFIRHRSARCLKRSMNHANDYKPQPSPSPLCF